MHLKDVLKTITKNMAQQQPFRKVPSWTTYNCLNVASQIFSLLPFLKHHCENLIPQTENHDVVNFQRKNSVLHSSIVQSTFQLLGEWPFEPQQLVLLHCWKLLFLGNLVCRSKLATENSMGWWQTHLFLVQIMYRTRDSQLCKTASTKSSRTG